MITCPKCGKENQDHYKFCLGCGAELPRGGGAAKPFTSEHTAARRAGRATAPRADRCAPVAAPAATRWRDGSGTSPSQQPTPLRLRCGAGSRCCSAGAPGMVTCPQCGHGNVAGNRFCASCGYNLSALSGAQAVPAAAAPVAAAARRRTAHRAHRAARRRHRSGHVPLARTGRASPWAATPARSSRATATFRRVTRRSAGAARSSRSATKARSTAST